GPGLRPDHHLRASRRAPARPRADGGDRRARVRPGRRPRPAARARRGVALAAAQPARQRVDRPRARRPVAHRDLLALLRGRGRGPVQRLRLPRGRAVARADRVGLHGRDLPHGAARGPGRAARVGRRHRADPRRGLRPDRAAAGRPHGPATVDQPLRRPPQGRDAHLGDRRRGHVLHRQARRRERVPPVRAVHRRGGAHHRRDADRRPAGRRGRAGPVEGPAV
ncbi:MAG: hypothetical protein AVDCRST_MAG13-239, partial [uncultured Solirubrobacteraceae bacterium]